MQQEENELKEVLQKVEVSDSQHIERSTSDKVEKSLKIE